jgi:ABC-type transport system substrate-binding protein
MAERIQRGDVNVSPQDVGWIATGPFKMLRQERGSKVQVRRSDVYWEKDSQGRQLPYLDGIDYAIIRDPAAVDAAFRVGRLDGGSRGAGHWLTRERRAGYIRDLGDRVWFAEIGNNGGTAYAFNLFKKGPWQDVRVRKAITLWLDRRAHVESVYGGFGQLVSLLNPKNPYTDPAFASWPGWNESTRQQDRVEAKRLMAEAGYPNGFALQWYGPQRFRDQGEYLFGQISGLGIQLRLDLVDEAAWAAAEVSGEYESRVGGSADGAQPETSALRLSPTSISRFGATKFEDPKVTEYFRTIGIAPDLQTRVRLWREFERYYLVEKAYIIPLSSQLSVVPFRSHVTGVPVAPEGVTQNVDMATVWLDVSR